MNSTFAENAMRRRARRACTHDPRDASASSVVSRVARDDSHAATHVPMQTVRARPTRATHACDRSRVRGH
ncbi:hypothetical protein [Cupriavidus pampae]|uniref:hypothetical protein n=1 Tax=Cupriavidus pampae TaxID=659251 RepID=UPI001CC69B9A|nr:hypothetical protein [Cupriavidus pampae]